MRALMIFLGLLLLFSASGALSAQCMRPSRSPSIPDGTNATPDQMRLAMSEVKQFDAAISAYTRCLEEEYLATIAATDTSEQRRLDLKNIQIMKNNTAIEEAESVVAQFNAQLRLYKAARQPPSTTPVTETPIDSSSLSVVSDPVPAPTQEPPLQEPAPQTPLPQPETVQAESTQGRFTWESAKSKCQSLGFEPKSEDFGQCVLQLTR